MMILLKPHKMPKPFGHRTNSKKHGINTHFLLKPHKMPKPFGHRPKRKAIH